MHGSAIVFWICAVYMIAGAQAANDGIKKKCSESFVEVCSTGKSEKYCCVMGGQRCCTKSEYSEDQSKILQLIFEREEQSDQAEHEDTRSNGLLPDKRWKSGVILCAGLIALGFGLFCVADFLCNVCIFNHSSEKSLPFEMIEITEQSNRAENGLPAIQEKYNTVLSNARNDAEIDFQSSSANSTPERNKTVNSTSICENQVLKLQCNDLFTGNPLLMQSKSSDNISPKKTHRCSEDLRNCHSCRSSPVLCRTSPVLSSAREHSGISVKFATAAMDCGTIPKNSSLKKFSTIQSNARGTGKSVQYDLESESNSADFGSLRRNLVKSPLVGEEALRGYKADYNFVPLQFQESVTSDC